MKDFMMKMLSSDGKVSSKRFVTFVCLLFMLIGYTCNLFFNFDIKDSLFESLQWIVMAGIGFTASERFVPSKTPPQMDYVGDEDHVNEKEDI